MTTINLEHVTKIEGHARLDLKIVDGKVEKCQLAIMEGARYFEGILKGQKFNEMSHITSRICGVCSVVHDIAAVKAVENAFKIKVTEQTELLREVLNIGGIIQSHALHLYFLTLPDYMGKNSALELAKDNKEILERALRLKRLGNQIVFTIAGRDVHPISCIVGGFSRTPEKAKIAAVVEELKRCHDDAVQTVKLFMGLDYPEIATNIPQFSLTGKNYFDSETLFRCEKGACFPTTDYKKHFVEHLREGSPAEFATKDGKSYFVGALARTMHNIDMLDAESKAYAEDLVARKENVFMNIPAQAIEILAGINRSLSVLQNLELANEEAVEAKIQPCVCEGVSAVSAPRGILFHHYRFDEKGYCTYADITTPTTQNLAGMEDTIRKFVPRLLTLEEEEIKHQLEKLIRAYDPCISCSTHFLELHLEK